MNKLKTRDWTAIAVYLVMIVPLRLPISILLIHTLNFFATLADGASMRILCANVVITKMIYNIFLLGSMAYNVEMRSRRILGRCPLTGVFKKEEDEKSIFFWTWITIGLLGCYMIFDAISTHQLFMNMFNL